MTYDGVTYYYITNPMGDVTGIANESGTQLVFYYYTAYGTAYVSYNTAYQALGATLSGVNPLVYRGYVYDREIGLYYLQSRYYNPKVGRFINADALVSTGQGLLGNNMFAYCDNNPCNRVDKGGHCSNFLCFRIDCFKATCPTSQCYKSDVPKVIVIYDGRASGSPLPWGERGDNGFEHQGQMLINRLSTYCDVTGYAYTTMDEFVEIWNSLSGSYDAIYILGHGTPGSFNARGGTLSSCNSTYLYSDLNSVDVQEIYLYICNGDTLGTGRPSTAYNFANLTGAKVHAVRNGKLSFTWFRCYPYMPWEYYGEWTTTYPN